MYKRILIFSLFLLMIQSGFHIDCTSEKPAGRDTYYLNNCDTGEISYSYDKEVNLYGGTIKVVLHVIELPSKYTSSNLHFRLYVFTPVITDRLTAKYPPWSKGTFV
jgi:hypothetical protein